MSSYFFRSCFISDPPSSYAFARTMSLTCPHCLESGVPFLEKLLVSPKHPALCALCGGRSAVPHAGAMLSLVPLLAGVLAALFARGAGASVACLALGATLYLWAFMRRVPLVRLPTP